MFQGTKWQVVALGVRVFLGFLGLFLGVSRGKFFFSCCEAEEKQFYSS